MNFAPTTTPQTDVLTTISDRLLQFYNSPFVLVLKILIAIYVIIIFIDIILLLILRDVPSDLRKGMRGMDIPVISKKKMQKRWNAIRARLAGDDATQYKVAIIEADTLVDEILAGIGYQGQSMSEKFDKISPAHLDSHYEALKDVHNVRNRIVQEADFSLDKKTTEDVLVVYENFLKYLEYME